MFATHKEMDVPKHPVLLLIAATVIGILSANLLAAESRDPLTSPPRLLPEIDQARPMPAEESDAELAAALWQVLEEHAAGRVHDAVATWQQMDLPNASTAWRELGLGAALLEQGEVTQAAARLATARKLAPENPLVHYYLGLTSMEQAARAREYYDAVRTTPNRLVSHASGEAGSAAFKPRSRHELEAMQSFELAVRHTADLDHDAPLTPVRWVVPAPYPLTEPASPPTVGDLVDALRADNFTGKSHGMLAQLYLEHGPVESAEQHLDAAHAAGISIPYGYRQVGELYEEQGRSTDAFRAYLKAVKHGDGLAAPGAKAAENLRKAFEELF